MRIFIAIVFILLILTKPLVSNAQWWNLTGPKDYNDCVLKNIKSGMGGEAVKLVEEVCFEKFLLKSDPNQKKLQQNLDLRYSKCRIKKEYLSSHIVFSGEGAIESHNSKNREFLSRIKSLKYDAVNSTINFQNMNSFGVSLIQLGFTNSKSCPSKKIDYSFITICNNNDTDKGVGFESYGGLRCGSLPKEAKLMGYCAIGFSPMYSKYDDTLLELLEKQGYCN